MKNKCVLGLGLVVTISIASVVAFVFSFIGSPEIKANDREIVAQITVTEDNDIYPLTTAFEQTEVVESTKACKYELSDEDSYMLTKIAMAEAESEDVQGKALVMLVVLNRLYSENFPDDIEAVIFQDGQFSPISNGRYEEVEPDEDCYRALQLIQIDGWDQSYGATYFESKSDSAWHSENLTFLFKHGNHYFYKE